MQFDLKDALIYFVDGYSETGAVDNVAGYSAAAVTMTVQGIVGEVPIGATFVMPSDTTGTVYTVSAQTPTLGNTTSITFTPGLAEAVVDDDVITFGGIRLQAKIGDGNCSYDEKRAIEYKKDRGKLDTVRLGDEEPMDVKFDLRWEFLKSEVGDPTSIPSIEEVLKRTGAAANWTSSSADPCEPYAVNIYVLYAPPCTTIKRETILLRDFRYEQLSHDFKQGMISCTGKCNALMAEVARVTVG